MHSFLLLALLCAEPKGIPVMEDFDSIVQYTLTNASGATVKVTNFGAIITSILVPDREGRLADVALGYNRVEDYINAVDKPYFGAIVGRVGNRIAGGKFSIGNETYTLAANNPPNHLHGGTVGFDKVVWDAKTTQGKGWNGVELHYHAKDREEGYPGNLHTKVEYRWNDQNELTVLYHATTDKATPVNLTQHTYFNLRGEGDGDILGHEVTIDADRFTPVDETMIPTGELHAVEGTPFDFRRAKPIGRDIDAKHEQTSRGKGFDHNWVLNKPSIDLTGRANITVHDPSTGRRLEVFTTEPGVQFYCGNFLDGRLKGKSGKAYLHRGGFCLETQHFPDSPNQPTFPSVILEPGKEYRSTTVFRFSARP